MKFLNKLYLLPIIIGILVSLLLWVNSYKADLRVEGMARLNFNHPSSNNFTYLLWDANIQEILKDFDQQTVTKKRELLRFGSKKNDKDEIKKNYKIVKERFKEYKKEYLEIYLAKITLSVNSSGFSQETEDRVIKNETRKMLDHKFLGDLNLNEVRINNNHFIYITLLSGFFLSVILYNIKNIAKKPKN